MHSVQPKFGAILIKRDQLNKLNDSSLGNPDFQANYTRDSHTRNNTKMAWALRDRTDIADLHVGSCWGSENGSEPSNKTEYQDAVLFSTQADSLPGIHPKKGEYNGYHQDEEALTKALDRLDIQYERGPFKALYEKAYQTIAD